VTEEIGSVEPNGEMKESPRGGRWVPSVALGLAAFALVTVAMGVVFAWASAVGFLIYGLLALVLVVGSLVGFSAGVKHLVRVFAALFLALVTMTASFFGGLFALILLMVSCAVPNADCPSHGTWVTVAGPTIAVLVTVAGCWWMWRLGTAIGRWAVPPTPFRFFARKSVPVRATDTGERIGTLMEGGEYTAVEVAAGEVLVEDKAGRRGWVPVSALRR
jgi:hypothetical protein